MGRALSTSVVLHGLAVGIVMFIMATRPPIEELQPTPEMRPRVRPGRGPRRRGWRRQPDSETAIED